MGINNGKNGNHQTEGYDEKGKTNYILSSKESVLQQKRPREPNKSLTGHVPLQVGMLGGGPPPREQKIKEKPIGSWMDGLSHGNCWTMDKPHRLLLPPVIKFTGLFATGVTTEALRKQNKQQRIETLLRQPMESQWTIHWGFNILPHDVWSQQQQIDITSQMAPQRLAL